MRLLAADEELHVLLLERCVPGHLLRELPEPEQDMVLAGLLRRMWRCPPAGHPFRGLETMLDYWSAEAQSSMTQADDPGLVREGIQLFNILAASASQEALLATDLHAGNALRSVREPWLVIEPKPFVGDTAFEATQHLLNCADRLFAQPDRTIKNFAELLELNAAQVSMWTFARVAVATATGERSRARWARLASALKGMI